MTRNDSYGGFKPSNNLNVEKVAAGGASKPMKAINSGTFYGLASTFTDRPAPVPQKRPKRKLMDEDDPIEDEEIDAGKKDMRRESTSAHDRKRRKLDEEMCLKSQKWNEPIVFKRMDTDGKAFNGTKGGTGPKALSMRTKDGRLSGANSSQLPAGDFPKMSLKGILIGERYIAGDYIITFDIPREVLEVKQEGRHFFSVRRCDVTEWKRSLTDTDNNPVFLFATRDRLTDPRTDLSEFKSHYFGAKVGGSALTTPKNQIMCLPKTNTEFDRFCANLASKSHGKHLLHLNPSEVEKKDWFLLQSGALPDEDEQPALQKTVLKPRSTRNSGATFDLDPVEPISPGRKSTRLRKKKIDPAEELFTYEAIVIRGEDYARLDEGEFLNDSIIELELKRIFSKLPEEIQRQTYMFNSFFYHQLSSDPKAKKDPVAMHKRVKRWTSKVNLFEKKYIIVPINESLHWYLAVIYNPAAILEGGAEVGDDVEEDSLPQKKRSGPVLDLVSSDVEDERDQAPILAKRAKSAETPPEEVEKAEGDLAGDKDTDSSEASPAEDKLQARDPQAEGDQMDVDSVVQQDTRTEGDVGSLMANADESPQVESPEGPPQEEHKGMLQVLTQGLTNTVRSAFSSLEDKFFPPAQGTAEPNEARGVNGEMEDDERAGSVGGLAGDRETKTEAPFEIDPKKGYIFQFDSLGSKGSEVGIILNSYLRQEAKVKKIKDLSGKSKLPHVHVLNVPRQQNHSDCGVYVLKYVDLLLKEPAKYLKLILDKHEHPQNKLKELWFKQGEAKKLRAEMRTFFDEKRQEKKEADGTAGTANGTTNSTAEDLVVIDA